MEAVKKLNLKKFIREMEYEALTLPAFVLYTVFSIIPILGAIYYSLTDWDGITAKVNFVGLTNYVRVLQDTEMVYPAIRNTLVYAVACTLLITILAVPLAVVLDSKIKTAKFLRAVFFFPSVPSALVIGYIWSFMLVSADYGPVNMVLGFFGINPVNWLGDPVLANISIIVVTLWCGTGWHAVIYIANLQAIPEEYYESANIDGASAFQSFYHITVPLLTPAFSVSCLFLLTGAFKLFDLPYALTGGGPGNSSFYIVMVIITRGIRENYYGLANALSVILLVLVLITSIIQQYFVQKREDRLL